MKPGRHNSVFGRGRSGTSRRDLCNGRGNSCRYYVSVNGTETWEYGQEKRERRVAGD